MAKKTTDRLAYGLTIMIYGFLFLLSKTGILQLIPYGERLISVGTLFLIAGIVFLSTAANTKLGLVLTGIGVIINADFFFGWINSYSSLIVPLALIAVGLVMVLNNKK